MNNKNKKEIWSIIQSHGDSLINKLSHFQIIQEEETHMHIFVV